MKRTVLRAIAARLIPAVIRPDAARRASESAHANVAASEAAAEAAPTTAAATTANPATARTCVRSANAGGLLALALLACALVLAICPSCASQEEPGRAADASSPVLGAPEVSHATPEDQLASMPPYQGTPFSEIDGGAPGFSPEEIQRARAGSFEEYAPLDALGRCGAAMACVGLDTMPTQSRGDIWHVKPTGWHTSEYDFVEGEKLYNRCHLIGFQLTAENDNERNLITGTRYLNATGMLPFEERIAEYVKTTGNHVLYRVTPLFAGDDMVARGVVMEARSVEDDGRAISFNVYCHNVQPGVDIDYATGDNRRAEASSEDAEQRGEVGDFVINTNTRKFHLPECPAVTDIAEKNKQIFTGSCTELIEQGLAPCKKCNPDKTR